uniref:DNA-directed primase/polymerase protein n=1 Tax=Erigeron canadensis TaxID=72917 RepID=UPI001CB8F414|nr:DNA-directed primase/polymerase protein [Erigeron canadensis]
MADDVNRLFESFKCGISPPQSAAILRKCKKRKVQQGKSNEDPSTSTSSDLTSAVSSGKKQLSATNFYTPTIGKKRLNNGSQFSPVIFYGSPQGVPPKRPARLLRLLHEIRVELAAQNKAREDVWKTFPRQDEAMKYAKDHEGSRVFSYQDHASGQRRFLVSTYKEFWRRYKNMNSKFRHHYEVIQEGLPCHLYFDLEFNIKENAERNGDEMVDLLILVIFEALLEKYSIEGDTNWIVELDSSTKDKFSRHLIIRLPGVAFKDNIHVGAFVAEICSRIHIARGRDKRYEQLFIIKDSSSADVPCHLFVDTAVYSRNRCFRLHLSSKAGKSSLLVPTGRFKCKEMNEEDVFMASLICNIDADCEKLLICKMDLDCVKVLHFDIERNIDYRKPAAREFVPTACTSNGYFSGKSPFPALDEFVEYIATIGSIQGKIRSWYWFSEDGLMVYSMLRNRFCERIGRQHKSNHVMYVVDLQMAAYYQKCYDPDCRGYRSPMRPVPPGVLPDSFNYSKIGDQNGTREFIPPCGEESPMDSCQKDEWWREAMVVADKVENMPRKLDLCKEDDVWDEDDEWWMAAANTASQIELTYCRQD